jgi:hypothetical protein
MGTAHGAVAVSANRSTIDAILLEYDVQTRDRRLYAQSMFGTIGFVVGGGVALLAAGAQAHQPLMLLLVPPLFLAGGVLVVVLRVHLLRVSVFLTVVEEDLRQRLGEAAYPIVWETTMTGRAEAVTSVSSPARSSAGLSITIMLLMGVAVSAVLVWPATLLYWQAGSLGNIDIIGGITRLTGLPSWPVEWAYPALNVMLVAYIVYSWVELPNVLEAARAHFRRTRARISDGSDMVLLDEIRDSDQGVATGPSWRGLWQGRRDGAGVVLEVASSIPTRGHAQHWGRLRTRRLYLRAYGSGTFEPVQEALLVRLLWRLRGQRPPEPPPVRELPDAWSPESGKGPSATGDVAARP